jgi:hypothetical protein
MTLRDAITPPGSPFGVCWGTFDHKPCPVSQRRHERGMIDGFGVIHFADRRFTKIGAKNLLMLIAKRDREDDPGFLNDPIYDFLYPALDALRAQQLAGEMGFRLPARLFDKEREQARTLAARRHVSIRRYPRLRSWLARAS